MAIDHINEVIVGVDGNGSRVTPYWRFTTTYSEITSSAVSDLLERDGRNKRWSFRNVRLETKLNSNLFILEGSHHFHCTDTSDLLLGGIYRQYTQPKSHMFSNNSELSKSKLITEATQTPHPKWKGREEYPDLKQLRADFDAVYSLSPDKFSLLPGIKQAVVGVYGKRPTPVLFVRFGSGFVVPSKKAFTEAGKDDITALSIDYKLVHRTLFGGIELTRREPGFEQKKTSSGIETTLYDRLRVE